jgi:Ras-related protein Rab-5C
MSEFKSMVDLKIKTIILKVVLIGETAVGKSSIINRFIKNQFYNNFTPTMSGTCVTKEIFYEQYNKILKYEIWDTAGQEKYRSLTKLFYKDASIVILVFDITRKDTFEEIRDFWLKQVKENSNEDIVISLVGNKEDNYEYEDIDNNNIELFVNQINCLYKKVSAKSGFGIENLFYDIGLKYLEPEKYNTFLSKSVEYKKGNISLSDFSKGNITQQIIEEDKKNCCL